MGFEGQGEGHRLSESTRVRPVRGAVEDSQSNIISNKGNRIIDTNIISTFT